jgi:hypothetical protein
VSEEGGDPLSILESLKELEGNLQEEKWGGWD